MSISLGLTRNQAEGDYRYIPRGCLVLVDTEGNVLEFSRDHDKVILAAVNYDKGYFMIGAGTTEDWEVEAPCKYGVEDFEYTGDSLPSCEASQSAVEL